LVWCCCLLALRAGAGGGGGGGGGLDILQEGAMTGVFDACAASAGVFV
jgi:hypothetical protein